MGALVVVELLCGVTVELLLVLLLVELVLVVPMLILVFGVTVYGPNSW